MMKVGPKVCSTTASHPGFLAFGQLIQTGIHPTAGRFGSSTVDMRETLNPMGMYRYTVLKDGHSHGEMHHDNVDEIYGLCGHRLDMVVEGPWDPCYEIIRSDLPQRASMVHVPGVLGGAFARKEPVPKVALFISHPVLTSLVQLGYGATIGGTAGAVLRLRAKEDLFTGILRDTPAVGHRVIMVHAGDAAAGKRVTRTLEFTFAEDSVHN